MRAALILALAACAPALAHVCQHDAYIVNKTAVQAPPTDGARARRDAVANAAPIRIKAVYVANNGGADIATNEGMTAAYKTAVTNAVSESITRFSQLLKVSPVTGNLYAYRQCTSMWTNGRCAAVESAPSCGSDDVALPLANYLGAQTIYPVSSSAAVILPAAAGAGVSDADIVIFITAKQTSTCGVGGSGTIAYASYCQRASNDRPTFGRVNFCPGMLSASNTAAGYADLLSTTLHEITHVLAFSSSLFPYFRDDSNVERTARDSFGYPADAFYKSGKFVASSSTISYANERGMDCSWGSASTWANANIPYGLISTKAPGDCVARISTPRVKAASRAFFNCDTVEGAELENQDTSDGFVQGSHWEARTLGGEYMAAYSATGAKITPLTLAVFEDSGWYTAVYSNADPLVAGRDWGYKQGCAFATQKCSATNTGSPAHFNFGVTNVDGNVCTVDRAAVAFTGTATYTAALPTQYQYYNDPKVGGKNYYDYCPALQGYSDVCTSASTGTSVMSGTVVGTSSRCHVTTLNSFGAAATSSTAGCYAVTCAPNGQSYTLTTKLGSGTCTTDGATISIAGYGGTVTCGSPAIVCGAGEVWTSLCLAGFGYDAALGTCTACPSGYTGAGGANAVCVALALPSPSGTPTSAATPTRTPTSAATGSGTATPSPTPSPAAAAASGSQTPSASPSATPPPTPSTTTTLTATPRSTPTATSTPPVSVSPTTTPSLSSSLSSTPTASVTLGASASITSSNSGTGTPTSTVVPPSPTPTTAPGPGTEPPPSKPSASATPAGAPPGAETASPTPPGALAASRSGSASPTPSNSPLVTPSSRSPVLRLSLIFSGSAGSLTFSVEMQATIIASAADALRVPRASIGWLGVTSAASAAGVSRRAQAGTRVQLSILPAAATASTVVQASVASGALLSAAVSSVLDTGFVAALAAQPGALTLASSLGYDNLDRMKAAVSLDRTIPVEEVIMSATRTPSPTASSSPASGGALSAAAAGGAAGSAAAAATGSIVGGIAAAVAALYLISVAVVASCARWAWCSQHARFKERVQAQPVWAVWCWCFGCRVARPAAKGAKPRGGAVALRAAPQLPSSAVAPRVPIAELEAGAAFIAACKAGDAAAVAAALAAAPRLANAADAKGLTGAAFAARAGHVGVLEVLFAAGADANARDANALSVLHFAVLGKTVAAVAAVLAAGADAGALDRNKKTPLELARMVGAADVEAALVRHASSRAAKSPARARAPAPTTPAASRAAASPARDAGAAFIAACKAGDAAAVAAALAAAPRLANAADAKGITGAAFAARLGHVAVLEVLFAAGADANARDANTLSVLHHAVLSRAVNAVHAVLAAGASATARDAKNNTPLDLARVIGASDIEAELVYAAPW